MMARLTGWVFLAMSAPILADGGAVLLHEQRPPFVITVFGSPVPLHAGVVDLSVFVQSSETLEPMLDADVQIRLRSGRSEAQLRATRAESNNRLMYSASAHLDDPGKWDYSLSVKTGSQAVDLTGSFDVSPEPPKLVTYWPYLLLPFCALAVFALHQKLSLRRLAQPPISRV